MAAADAVLQGRPRPEGRASKPSECDQVTLPSVHGKGFDGSMLVALWEGLAPRFAFRPDGCNLATLQNIGKESLSWIVACHRRCLERECGGAGGGEREEERTT